MLEDAPEALPYVEKDLKDYFDIQIFAPIYIGSQRQEFNLIFDTGSAWLWVGHASCDTCANPAKFDSRASSTFRQLSQWATTLAYGMGQVLGLDTTDQVCLSRDSELGNGCMADYLFKTVVY